MAKLLRQDGTFECDVSDVQIAGAVTNMGTPFACVVPASHDVLALLDGYFTLVTDKGERFTCSFKRSRSDATGQVRVVEGTVVLMR